MTPRAMQWLLTLVSLQLYATRLAAGETRETLAAEVVDYARRAGRVLDT